MPLRISIITPGYNQGKFLEENILSVLHQDYPNLEHIIVDGSSTDNTASVLDKYSKDIACIISEADKGQSDAVNKGFAKATGDIIGWLNSDDYYAPNALQQVAKAFEGPKVDVVCGYSILFDENGQQLPGGPTLNKEQDLPYHLRFPNINQPATFFRKKVLAEFMPLSTALHYIMDRELWLKYLLKYGITRVKVIENNLVYFRIHKDSKSVSKEEKFDDEYATLLYHLALHHSMKDIAELLGNRYRIEKTYIPSFTLYPDQETTLDMIRYFVVKRGSLVYNEEQFRFAKKAYKLLHLIDYKYFAGEEKGKQRMNIIASSANWLHFKIKRKLSETFG
jgi:glycosyltransferase involved in cell wall biosynthesis